MPDDFMQPDLTPDQIRNTLTHLTGALEQLGRIVERLEKRSEVFTAWMTGAETRLTCMGDEIDDLQARARGLSSRLEKVETKLAAFEPRLIDAERLLSFSKGSEKGEKRDENV